MLAERIVKRDLEGVKKALEAGAKPDERDERENPAILLAAITDQYRIANLLLDAGADIYATDKFGLSAGSLAEDSRLLPDSIEGHAHSEFVAKLKAKGHPWPPPGPKKVRELKAENNWPPHTMETR